MDTPERALRVGILTSHPIQYQAPWFRELAKYVELKVFFAHQPSSEQQGEGFEKAFSWDVDLLSGYDYHFIHNVAKNPSTSHYSGCDTPEIARHISKGGFDAFIVNGWYLKSYWQAVKACRKAGIPVLVRGDSQLGTPRSKLKELVKKVLYRKMLKRFDGFLTVGKRNEEYLRYYGVPEKKLFPAPHFVDNDWFAEKVVEFPEKVVALRYEWRATDIDLVVVFVGKLIPGKRTEDLLPAIERLNVSQSCRLVYVGSGELEETLHRQAADLVVQVEFAGFKNQSDLPLYYAAADVVVLPSASETWGLVVNEAMACGTPVIVSDACGCAPDLIDEGMTGFTFPVGNIEALANRLSQMAELKKAGHDWRPALDSKLKDYSVTSCTAGTLTGLHQIISRKM